MRRITVIGFVIGVIAATAAVLHAGTGSIAEALKGLPLKGLLALALLHIPIVVLMGVAWWLISGRNPPASALRFLWARLVRDAAGEVLPFLQFGGAILAVRTLGRGQMVTSAVAAACLDGVVELTAKLPYVLAALFMLLELGRHGQITRLLSVSLAATTLVIAFVVVARRSLGAWLGAMARVIRARWPAVFAPNDGGAAIQVQGYFDQILRQRTRLWWTFVLHVCCWGLGAGETWVIFRLLGWDINLAQALAIDGTVVGLRSVGFMIPAAAGVQEWSFVLAAAVFGIPSAAALAASFARRARDLLLGVGTLSVVAAGEGGAVFGRFRV